VVLLLFVQVGPVLGLQLAGAVGRLGDADAVVGQFLKQVGDLLTAR